MKNVKLYVRIIKQGSNAGSLLVNKIFSIEERNRHVSEDKVLYMYVTAIVSIGLHNMLNFLMLAAIILY